MTKVTVQVPVERIPLLIALIEEHLDDFSPPVEESRQLIDLIRELDEAKAAAKEVETQVPPVPAGLPPSRVLFKNTVPPHYDLGNSLEWNDIRLRLLTKLESAPRLPYSQVLAWDKALEYLVRGFFKNGKDDFHKASHYLNQLIALVNQGDKGGK